MLKKASYIGYTAFLATGPALLTACSSTTAADQAQDPSVLFSLSSDAMHFENPNGLDVTLVMEGVDPHTIWFTDRPARESGAITTSRFVQDWQPGGTFDIDPPNAALVLHEPTKVDSTTAETLVAEIQNASYDAANKTFRADLKVLLDQEAATLDGNLAAHGDRHDNAWPSRAGAVSLFIDSVSLAAVSTAATPAASTSAQASASKSATASTQASASQSSTAKPLAVTGANFEIMSDNSLHVSFTTPANSSAGPFTYQVTMFDQTKTNSAVLTSTVLTTHGNSVLLAAPISANLWSSIGGGDVSGTDIYSGRAYFSVTAVNANGTGPAVMSSLQIPHLAVKTLSPSTPPSDTGTIKLCSTPSSCNTSGTDNYTYNSTIYFQTTISDSPSSMERLGVIGAPMRMD